MKNGPKNPESDEQKNTLNRIGGLTVKALTEAGHRDMVEQHWLSSDDITITTDKAFIAVHYPGGNSSKGFIRMGQNLERMKKTGKFFLDPKKERKIIDNLTKKGFHILKCTQTKEYRYYEFSFDPSKTAEDLDESESLTMTMNKTSAEDLPETETIVKRIRKKLKF